MKRPRACSSAGFARATQGGRHRKGGNAPLRGSRMGEHVVMLYGKERP